MGILIKKRQAGGSLFADPRYLKLNADTPMQAPGGSGGKQNFAKSMTGGSKAKTGKSDLEGLLPSDIKFYQSEASRIDTAIADGFKEKGLNFDESSEHTALLQEKHTLEGVLRPQMKSFNKLYEKAFTKFGTNMAGDAPAMYGGSAVVKALSADKKSYEYKVISEDELLSNPTMYSVVNGQEVLNLRKNNPAFSGFTRWGQIADNIINTAYGSKSFDKELDAHISNAGYDKGIGKYIKTSDQSDLGLESLVFDEKTDLISTKTNYNSLVNLHNALMSDPNNLTNYLRNKSMIFLQRKLASGVIKIDDKDNTLNELKHRSISTQLALKLRSSAFKEVNEARKKAGKTGSDTKDKKGNIFTNAKVNLFKHEHSIEIDNKHEFKNPAEGSIVGVFPAGHVQKGYQYFELGYGEDNKKDGDADKTEGNRKTLANNSLIYDMMGDESLMTTFDGTPLTEIVDNGDLHLAVIPKNTGMHVMLAPTIVDETGKVKVDFANEFSADMLKAISKTYEDLKAKGITEADVAGGNEDVIKQAQDLAKKNLKEILGDDIANPPVIRATIAFKVNYESDGDSWGNAKAGWQVDNDRELYDIIEEPSKLPFSGTYAKETYAFIPISQGFWTGMFQEGTLPGHLENKVSAARFEGLMKSEPTVKGTGTMWNIQRMVDNTAFKQYGENKKQGGKLLSTEEIRTLLFN